MAIPPDTTSDLPPAGTRCNGTTKTGGPCGNPAMQGGYVCRMHGGSAPQVREAAARRLQRAQMDRDLGRLMTEMEYTASELGPTDILLDAVYRSHAMVQIIGAYLGDLKTADGLTRTDRYGHAQPHVLTLMYDTWVDRAARAAKLALDAGIAERLVRVEQERTELLAQVIRAVFNDPELALTDGQRDLVPMVMGRHLRALNAG